MVINFFRADGGGHEKAKFLNGLEKMAKCGGEHLIWKGPWNKAEGRV